MKHLSADHILLMKHTCPFCMKVVMALEELQVQMDTRDVARDPDAQRLLLQRGGKQQVPCLLHGDHALYESDAIIAYLRKQAQA